VEPNGQLNGAPQQPFNAGFAGLPLAGLAIGPSGNLWVFNKNGRLFQFDDAGTSLMTPCNRIFSAGTKTGGIASVGPNALDVIDAGGHIQRLEPASQCANPGQLTSGSNGQEPRGLAADTSDDDLYVTNDGLLIEDISFACAPSAAGGCEATQIFGGGQLNEASGLAVDPESGSVFAANGATDEILAFTLAVEAEPSPSSEVTATEATLRAKVNPVGSELSRCAFEYGETVEYGKSVACSESLASIGAGHASVDVQTKVEDLIGGTSYHYRLRVTNANGDVRSEDEGFSTAPTGRIEEVAASKVEATSAILTAKVNPEGLAAAFHFEFGPCPSVAQCHESPYTDSAPIPNGAIQASTEAQVVSEAVSGLSPGVTYHFRLRLSNVNGVAHSPEGTFVFEPAAPVCGTAQQGSVALPDCRGYEMVTPPDKNAALIDNGGLLTGPSIAADGERVLSKSIQCFHGPPSCIGIRQTEGEPFSFRRTENGWTTEPLAPSATVGNTMLRYDSDSGLVLYALAAPTPELEQFYVREVTGALRPIGPLGELPGIPIPQTASSPLATTSDFSRIAYESEGLWPSLESGLTTGSPTILEYTGTENVAPTPVPVSGPLGSQSYIGACGANIGATGHTLRPMSSDGRMIFFSVKACATGTGENVGKAVSSYRLYTRTEGEHGMATTWLSQHGAESDCSESCRNQPEADAEYEGASADGSHVYFASTQQLTNEATPDTRPGDDAHTPGCQSITTGASGCNLYEAECANRCESASDRRLIDVSGGDSSGSGPRVQGVMAIPSEGDDVYFVARGVLTETANGQGEQPAPGKENLYVYAPDAEAPLKFIATLSTSDQSQWQAPDSENLTPDGQFLVFTSHRGLTPDASRSEGPAQVYRYDLASGTLSRISIGEEGFDDNGNASLVDARLARPGATMSTNGQLVFFESPAGLTPSALNDHAVTRNEHVLAENVYEWEAPGARLSESAPTCGEPGGCVWLISDGRDLNEGSDAHANLSAVELLGTDSTGANVFFWTADQLVSADTDSQIDLYDARVNGGFPEPGPLPSCATGETIEGGVCRSPLVSPPVFGAPGSSLFAGPGNITPAVIKSSTKPSTPRKRLTAAQVRAAKLKRALKDCKDFKKRVRRTACEKRARSAYGAKAGVRKAGDKRGRKR
jgi:hypothetical protein